jgi:hypothetical protein
MPDSHRLPFYALTSTPESSPNLPDAFHRPVGPIPREQATAAPQAPELAVRSKVRHRQRWDIDTPERLRGSLQSKNYGGANHCGMRDGQCMTCAMLLCQPALDAGKEVLNRLAAMRRSINIGEPSKDAVRVLRLNLVQRFPSPRTIV